MRTFKKICGFVFNKSYSEVDYTLTNFLTKVDAFLYNKLFIEYHVVGSHKRSSSGYPARREQGLNVDRIEDSKSVYDVVTKDNIAFLNKVAPIVKRGKFLDVGCSTGYYSEIIKDAAPKLSKLDYYGSDISRNLITVAQANYPSASFFVSLAQRIPKPANYFDIVFCSSVLQYTLFDWMKTLKEMARVTNKYVVVTRLPLLEEEETFLTEQRVVRRLIRETRKLILVNRKGFELFATKKMKMKIVRKQISIEKGVVMENKIGFKCWNYLLAKQNI